MCSSNKSTVGFPRTASTKQRSWRWPPDISRAGLEPLSDRKTESGGDHAQIVSIAFAEEIRFSVNVRLLFCAMVNSSFTVKSVARLL
jgi:hypothetical protein